MSDLLAKCDWQDSELHVEVGVWPEVVTVWVGGKAMPYAPVTTDLAEEVMSKAKAWGENAKLRAEIAELEGTIKCLQGLAEATSDENAKLRDQLEEQKCFAADLEKDVRALRELVREMWEWLAPTATGSAAPLARLHARMRELGCEVS